VQQKEITTQEDLFTVLDLIEAAGIPYWLDGGWGVDALCGRQTRPHRDIDIDFDATYTQQLLDLLTAHGYKITTDWRPVRIELYHPRLSYIDIHPFQVMPDGTASQADPTGGRYQFPADYFTTVTYAGRTIPAISIKGQEAFHTGYDLRETDKQDLQNLKSLSPNSN